MRYVYDALKLRPLAAGNSKLEDAVESGLANVLTGFHGFEMSCGMPLQGPGMAGQWFEEALAYDRFEGRHSLRYMH